MKRADLAEALGSLVFLLSLVALAYLIFAL